MKYYIEELADHLKAVLKMRQRIKDRVFRCKQLASNYAKVFGELSQIEVSVNDEISALKNAYVEAAGEIETHVRSFNRYNERGQLYSSLKVINQRILRDRSITRFGRVHPVL